MGQVSTVEEVAVAEPAPSEAASFLGSQALERFNAGEWSNAVHLARRQILAPTCSDAIKAEMHHVLAACHYQMGQLQDAEKEIKKRFS